MIPDLDLQLQSAIKALQDIVGPAVDPGNKMAAEQLHLTIATLAMVRLRLPMARRFTRRLLEDDVQMAGEVVNLLPPDSLGKQLAVARAALLSPELETGELEDIRAELNRTLASAISKIENPVTAAAIGKIVLEAAKRPIELHRAWCLPSGFEAYPDQIAPLETLLR